MSLVDSVRKVIVPIHKEGYVFIAIGLVSTIILANLWSPFGWIGAIITIFLAGLAISAAAIVWFSLLIRKALLLVAIVFGPVALAGATWDATKGWFAKWATFVIALIFSPWPWFLVPIAAALIGGGWIWTRPEA